MKCNELHKKLVPYAEQNLPEAEMNAAAEHLSTCIDCNALYEEISKTWQLIDEEKEIAPDPFYFTRLEQRLSNEASSQQKRILPAWGKAIQNMAATIVLLLSIAAGVMLGSQYSGKFFMASGQDDYEYFSEIMYLNTAENETIENYFLNQEDE